jgi:hypothetical protein
MRSTQEISPECGSGERAVPRLEDLIPIAVVIAGGCEPCAERMVLRALRQGSPRRQIERTLGIVAHLRSQGCFAQAVDAEVIARMEKPLQAGRKALREAQPSLEDPPCCGEKRRHRGGRDGGRIRRTAGGELAGER